MTTCFRSGLATSLLAPATSDVRRLPVFRASVKAFLNAINRYCVGEDKKEEEVV